jgi:hypothetical protein
MKLQIHLCKSRKKGKKFTVVVDNKTVHFGATGYQDYTIHKDKERMARYTKRHKRRENWGKSGIKTAGFWSKWLLWNKPSLRASIRDIEKRFNVKITYGKTCKRSKSRSRKRSRSKSKSRKRSKSKSRKRSKSRSKSRKRSRSKSRKRSRSKSKSKSKRRK